MSNPPPGPATAPDEKGRIHACLPSAHTRIASAGWVPEVHRLMIVVVPAGARRRQARKARPGGQGPCGGRAAHSAIVFMCDTADSLT
eukprot:scaffold8945_cov27-Phaeocystis_antarctica.AAC.1